MTDILEQQRLAEPWFAQDLSVRNLEDCFNPRSAVSSAAKTRRPSPAHLADLEKSSARQLGMRVQVRSGRKGQGRLILHYSFLDQFDDLLQKLGSKPNNPPSTSPIAMNVPRGTAQ